VSTPAGREKRERVRAFARGPRVALFVWLDRGSVAAKEPAPYFVVLHHDVVVRIVHDALWSPSADDETHGDVR
jgi:hypothetical protein